MNAALINNVTLCASNIDIMKLTEITTGAFIICRKGVTGWNTSFWVNTHTDAIVALHLLIVSSFWVTPDVWYCLLESETVCVSDGVCE